MVVAGVGGSPSKKEKEVVNCPLLEKGTPEKFMYWRGLAWHIRAKGRGVVGKAVGWGGFPFIWVCHALVGFCAVKFLPSARASGTLANLLRRSLGPPFPSSLAPFLPALCAFCLVLGFFEVLISLEFVGENFPSPPRWGESGRK